MGPFKSLFDELPPGRFWPNGKWWRRLGALLDADRARAVAPGLSEIPTKDGRFLQISAGVAVTFLAAVQRFDEDGNEYFDVMKTSVTGAAIAYDDPDDDEA